MVLDPGEDNVGGAVRCPYRTAGRGVRCRAWVVPQHRGGVTTCQSHTPDHRGRVRDEYVALPREERDALQGWAR